MQCSAHSETEALVTKLCAGKKQFLVLAGVDDGTLYWLLVLLDFFVIQPYRGIGAFIRIR